VVILVSMTIGENMRVAVLASGGKDSTYASWWSELQGWDIECIITVGIEGDDSMMFQIENTWIAGLQAAAIGTSWLPVVSKGREGLEMKDLESAIQGELDVENSLKRMWPEFVRRPNGLTLHRGRLEIDALVTGALRSDYQKTRLEMMCESLGIRSFCPIWHKSAEEHMESLVQHGFGVVFSSVSTEGMGAEWIGESLDLESLNRLHSLSKKFRFNLDGEGGEFETFVVKAPHFGDSIVFEGEPVWDGSRGYLKVNSCSLMSHR